MACNRLKRALKTAHGLAFCGVLDGGPPQFVRHLLFWQLKALLVVFLQPILHVSTNRHIKFSTQATRYAGAIAAFARKK
jgi:hypothetical protein